MMSSLCPLESLSFLIKRTTLNDFELPFSVAGTKVKCDHMKSPCNGGIFYGDIMTIENSIIRYLVGIFQKPDNFYKITKLSTL